MSDYILTNWFRQALEWLWNTCLKPVADLLGKFFRWWQMLVVATLAMVQTWLQDINDKLNDFHTQLVNLDVSHFALSIGFGRGAALVGQVNNVVPLDWMFTCFAAWLVIWQVCTVIRIAKNWLLENGW